MDEHSLKRIRNARFSHAVRGYDRHEVDEFMRELADWLESGGHPDVSAEVHAELERIGEQTGAILTEAHAAAEAIREDASAEARQHLVDANVTAESLRTSAGEYAEEAREDADAYARKSRAEADSYAETARADADEYAEATNAAANAAAEEIRAEASRDAERIVADANRRRSDVESVISDLEQRRDAVVAELDRLASGIAGTATQHRGERRDLDGEREPAAESDQASEPAQSTVSESDEDPDSAKTVEARSLAKPD